MPRSTCTNETISNINANAIHLMPLRKDGKLRRHVPKILCNLASSTQIPRASGDIFWNSIARMALRGPLPTAATFAGGFL